MTVPGTATCPDNYFKCAWSEGCLSQAQRCDGRADCTDKSDEIDCHSKLVCLCEVTDKVDCHRKLVSL